MREELKAGAGGATTADGSDGTTADRAPLRFPVRAVVSTGLVVAGLALASWSPWALLLTALGDKQYGTRRAAALVLGAAGFDEARAALEGLWPQKRLYQPAEITAAALFLCGPGSEGINGAALPITGGEI